MMYRKVFEEARYYVTRSAESLRRIQEGTIPR